MFTAIRNWIRGLTGRKGNPQPQGIYSRREQLTYQYFDGEKDVVVDPMTLWKPLSEIWPDLITDMKLANSQHSKAQMGWDAQVAKVRKVFSLKPFAEGGLTETGSMGVLYDFWWWCEELKKNYPPTPISAEATSPTSASTSAASPPTQNGSDFSSSGKENSTAEPVSSSSAAP